MKLLIECLAICHSTRAEERATSRAMFGFRIKKDMYSFLYIFLYSNSFQLKPFSIKTILIETVPIKIINRKHVQIDHAYSLYIYIR